MIYLSSRHTSILKCQKHCYYLCTLLVLKLLDVVRQSKFWLSALEAPRHPTQIHFSPPSLTNSHWCSTPSEQPKHPVLLRKFHKYPLQENSVSDINTSISPPHVLPCVDQMIRNHSFAYNCITQFPLSYQNVILSHVDQMFPPSSIEVTLNTCLLQSCWNPCIQSYLSHSHYFRMIHLIKILQHNSIGSKHRAQAAE